MLEARERTQGKEISVTIANAAGLAAVLEGKGDYAGAEPLLRRVLEARERTQGKEDPDTLNSMADLLEAQGDYAGAEPLLRRVLEAQKKVLGNEHLEVACALDHLAVVLSKQRGKEQEAEGLLRDSLAMHRKMGG